MEPFKTSRAPRVVFGLPAYNRPDALQQTLESLLSQSYRDFAIVIVDDAPVGAARAIVESYAALDPRVVYEPNAVRLGMIGNWRRAFVRSRELYPRSEYFAWASDHDVWHPRWLEVLIRTLDENPHVVLAYPYSVRIYPHERRRAAVFDTADDPRRARRLRIAATRLTAGNAIYGLFRAAALERAGVFHPVMMPDRQILVELSLLGEFRHVAETLWYREASGAFSYSRQRRMFFPAGAPLHTWLPANVQHCGVLVWDFAIRGRGRPAFGRLAGLGYALLQLGYTTRRELLRDDSRWREALRQTALGRKLLPGGRAARDLRRQAPVAATESR
jgi:glycosyltransferase involved in cell wall biosynthesis